MDDLRSRFRSEYLGQLVLKNSKKESREIKVGDVVLVGDDNRKRIDWPLARVIRTIPGRDDVIRVCVLKTKNGELTRPIQRLYPLEVELDREEFVDKLQKSVDVTEDEIRKDDGKKIDVKKPDVNKTCRKGKKKIVNDTNSKTDEEKIPPVVTTRSGRVSKKPVPVDV